MPPRPLTFRVAFSTPWFNIEESVPERPDEQPYYRMTGPDAVICWPFTVQGDILLVRQFRPTLGHETLELPAGAIDGDESIIAAASREILEETGHGCSDLAILASGRLFLSRTAHTEYFVLAFDAQPVEKAVVELGMEPVILTRDEFRKLVREDRFEQIAGLSLLGVASATLGVDLLRDPIDLIHQKTRAEVERRRRDGGRQD